MSKTTKVNNNRSKKYNANLEKIQQALGSEIKLSIEKAVEVLYSLDQPKYTDGPSVELHVKLNINPTKSDQFVRGTVVLPNGTGKTVRIAAFVTPENVDLAKKAGADVFGSEELIEQIRTSETTDFDIAIAQPEMMKKLPAIARILGTRGLMPNPKAGTVGDNIEELISQIKAGKVEFKNDKSSNIHIPTGKINTKFTVEKIVENIKTALDAIEKAKPEAVKKKYILTAHLSSTLSPSIRIQ